MREMGRKRQLRDLAVETAPFAMIGIDSDGAVTMINNQMRVMFGLTPHDIGRPFHELEVSYRPVELRSLIEQAYAEHRVVRLGSVERTGSTNTVQYLDIHIQPLWDSARLGAGTVVIFVDTTVATRLQIEVKRHREELEAAYEELQSTNEELETTNEELQSSIEELETTNEELQSTNEELETTNEELQSTNEELETMNEELQSTNEELETMNVELRERSAELDEVNASLETILSSLGVGVAVLDANQVVRVWNAQADDLWGVRQDEAVGQHVFGLDIGLPMERLARLLKDYPTLTLARRAIS